MKCSLHSKDGAPSWSGLALRSRPPALTYLSGIQWDHYIGATGAFFVSGVLMLAMRFITDTAPASRT